MKTIILQVLERFGCAESGQHCQVNLQSEGARIMIADALKEELDKYVSNLIEDIVCAEKSKYGTIHIHTNR